MESTIIISLIVCLFGYIYRAEKRLIRKDEEIKKKIKKIDDHLLQSVKKMEKKINRRGSDVEAVRKQFKKFQSNFLVFDEKVDKLTASFYY